MLDNYKTKIAAIGTILTGVGLIASSIAQHGFNFADIWQGIVVVLGGVATFGFRDAIQKIINVTKNEPK